MLAAALAQPRVETVASDRTALIVLLADVSQSMEASDIYPTRLDATIAGFHDLISELPATDQVALVTFSDKVDVVARPTTDRAVINSAVDLMSPEGGTALSEGVETAVRLIVTTLAANRVYHLGHEYLPAAIVLESDGAQDRGTVTPIAAAELAKAAGIRIYGVALGQHFAYITEGKGYFVERIPVPPDPATVDLVTSISGGEGFSATSASSLDRICRTLGLSIGRHPQWSEISSWLDIAAATLLALGIGVARARGGVLP
jgi:Ca-activated chloride channel family protein